MSKLRLENRQWQAARRVPTIMILATIFVFAIDPFFTWAGWSIPDWVGAIFFLSLLYYLCKPYGMLEDFKTWRGFLHEM